jgi:hypothetical protein
MNKSIEEGNYDKLKDMSEEAIGIKDSAFRLSGQINEAEKSIDGIKSQSMDLPESEKMLSLAKSAFVRGDYAKAEERLSSTMLIFAVESGNAGTWIFAAKYWWILAPAVLALGAGTIIVKRKFVRRSLMKNFESLIGEERIIQGLIESLQREHFTEKKTGTESYERSMKNYENGLNSVNMKRIDILSRLTKKLKPSKAMKMMDDEEKRVKNLMAEIQRKYFERGRIGKSYYEKTMKGLKTELLEIERIRETLDGGKHA